MSGRPVLAAALGLLGLVLGCAVRRDPPPGADGPTIYRLQLCANCHGEAGQGTGHGPPLHDLAAHWTAPDLAAFLADPPAVAASDPRLGALAAKERRAMGRYDGLDEPTRLRLAGWLLSRP